MNRALQLGIVGLVGASLVVVAAIGRGDPVASGPTSLRDAALQKAGPGGENESNLRGLDRDKVCFVNDRFMGAPQIPVQVNGQTYYGCCAGCETELRVNRSSRYAIDPVTGAEVDKATAHIALDPQGQGGKVLYFESVETYAAYLKRNG